jgi:ABC-type nickel/cobalt efflux system permease component RcnA
MSSMVRSTGVQIGLFAFAVALVAGLYVGNSATVVLTRALVSMAVAAVVGQLAAWTARLVLRDHLQRRKQQVDREHLAALEALSDDEPSEASAQSTEPVEVG